MAVLDFFLKAYCHRNEQINKTQAAGQYCVEIIVAGLTGFTLSTNKLPGTSVNRVS